MHELYFVRLNAKTMDNVPYWKKLLNKKTIIHRSKYQTMADICDECTKLGVECKLCKFGREQTLRVLQARQRQIYFQEHKQSYNTNTKEAADQLEHIRRQEFTLNQQIYELDKYGYRSYIIKYGIPRYRSAGVANLAMHVTDEDSTVA